MQFTFVNRLIDLARMNGINHEKALLETSLFPSEYFQSEGPDTTLFKEIVDTGCRHCYAPF